MIGSWYNRAGVERVMGFCTEEQAKRFLEIVPEFEHVVTECGTILLNIGSKRVARSRRADFRHKTWKLSPMGLESYHRWYDYSRARDEMFEAGDSAWAAWFVVRSDDKRPD